ncbi:MAG: hypothetical protein LBE12_13215, partial [Planctomycetaceae bacterium]|nr:hypothetical protein [Planctomycetaceae bacterium]
FQNKEQIFTYAVKLATGNLNAMVEKILDRKEWTSLEKIVRKNRHPEFLPNHFRRFATEMNFVHRLFQTSNVHFHMPTHLIQRNNLFLKIDFFILECCYQRTHFIPLSGTMNDVRNFT